MTELDKYESDFVEALLAAGWLETASPSPRRYQGTVIAEWQDSASGDWQSATHTVEVVLPAGFPFRTPIVTVRISPHSVRAGTLTPARPKLFAYGLITTAGSPFSLLIPSCAELTSGFSATTPNFGHLTWRCPTFTSISRKLMEWLLSETSGNLLRENSPIATHCGTMIELLQLDDCLHQVV